MFLRSLPFITVVFLTATFTNAQPIPAGYSIKSPADYHKYDSAALRCATWLDKVGPGYEKKKVEQVSKFLEYWMSGNEYMNYKSIPGIESVFTDNPEYKAYYLAGWIKFAFSFKGKPNPTMLAYSGIRSSINAYNRRKEDTRQPDIEDLAEADRKGMLKAWVQERVN